MEQEKILANLNDSISNSRAIAFFSHFYPNFIRDCVNKYHDQSVPSVESASDLHSLPMPHKMVARLKC